MRKAVAKSIPEIINNFSESFWKAKIATSMENKLKKRDWVSIRKLLERMINHGVKANIAAANNPVSLSYNKLPIPYTKTIQPRPNKVTNATPFSNDNPKILKIIASI